MRSDGWASRLPADITEKLRVPLIAAPMLRVSGPRLVSAVCRAGAIGAFPTANARTAETLDAWLTEIEGSHDGPPHCPNLIIRQPRLREHLEVLVAHRVRMVITSVGSPAPVIDELHEIGTLVFADVATVAHAQKAVAVGADGLVLLSAGAGGQTGWMNPFAFVRAVREFFDGPLVLAGGVSDGTALRAALVLGCDLGYMGTRFIATTESMASDAYRDLLVASSMDDVLLTRAFTGLPTNMLRPAIVAAGLDPDALDEQISPADAEAMFGAANQPLVARWADVFSAGHTVSAVARVTDAASLVDEVAKEFAGE
ncbi:MAG TPA: nitronate monooxygenase [Sporichthyaceae bacterium]|nr:nitronate monooxygenase [Sporichthyaceae bacterium]